MTKLQETCRALRRRLERIVGQRRITPRQLAKRIERGESFFVKERNGCTCDGCGHLYTVDLLVPDDVWNKVCTNLPRGESSMLCGSCLMARLERVSGFAAWKLVDVDAEFVTPNSVLDRTPPK